MGKVAEKTNLSKNDVVEILTADTEHDWRWGLQQIAEGTNAGNLICTLVATLACGFHDVEYARGIEHQCGSSWMTEVNGLQEWVEEHPEKFCTPGSKKPLQKRVGPDGGVHLVASACLEEA